MNVQIKFDNSVNAKLLSIVEYPKHIHNNNIQIIYVVEGKIELTVSFSKYTLVENDMHIINIGDVHGISYASNNNLVLVFNINVKSYLKKFPDLPKTIFISYRKSRKISVNRHDDSEDLTEMFFRVAKISGAKEEKMFGQLDDIGEKVIGILYNRYRYFSIDNVEKKLYTLFGMYDSSLATCSTIIEKANTIIGEIYQDYAQNITLKEIAEREYINYYYLSHFIKKATGENFRNILNMIRVEKSEVPLLTTNKPVSVISTECGFSSYKYYKKHFTKWFGMTPKKYRHTYNKKTIRDLKPIYKALPKVKDYLKLLQITELVLDTKSDPIEYGKVIVNLICRFIDLELLEPNYYIYSFVNMLGEDVLHISHNYIMTKQASAFNLAIYGDSELMPLSPNSAKKLPLLVILKNIGEEGQEITIKQTKIAEDGREIKNFHLKVVKEKIEHTIYLGYGDITLLNII